jgi:hypothetical protein
MSLQDPDDQRDHEHQHRDQWKRVERFQWVAPSSLRGAEGVAAIHRLLDCPAPLATKVMR